MFIFGHMGIGSKIVSPWTLDLPKRWLLIGTILPDLIDKPLYYGLVVATGKHALDLGLVSGTRSFGHTAILGVTLTLLAFFLRSRPLAALALGNATHLLLDSVAEAWMGGVHPEAGILLAILFPFLGWKFPVYPFHSAGEHLQSILHPRLLLSEAAGLSLLGWDFWKSKHRAEILASIRERRFLRIRRKKSKKAKHHEPV